MTWIAWVVLIVYLAGVVVVGNVILSMMRGEVEADATPEERAVVRQAEESASAMPGAALLLAAVATVFWPALPVAYGLNRLANGSTKE